MVESSQSWDVIVVGAGLGGLSTAAYLAGNGKRVLVVEAQPVLGGAAQTFRRRRVLEFNTGAHYVGDCSPDAVIPTVLRGIGLDGEVGFDDLDPDEFDRIVAPGFDFRVPRGWDAFERRLVETFPTEETGIRAVVGTLRRQGEAMERIGAPPVPSVRTLLRNLGSLVDLRDGAVSLQRLFDRHRLSPGARAAIGYISNFVLLPRERLASAVYAYGLHHYIKTGGRRISGNVGTLARTLARAVRCNGGEIRLRTRVERILVEDGRVHGVRLVGGTVLRAPVVVSNADVATTYGTLVAAEHLSPRRVRRYGTAGLSGCGFSVYLGVDLDIREHLPDQNVFDIGGLDYQAMLDTMFRSTREGFDPESAFLWITSATMEGRGDQRHSCLELTTLTPQNYAFWGLDGGSLDGVDYHRHPAYLQQKERIEQALVRRTLRRFPFLEGRIVWQESSTMLSHEDWTLNRFAPWAGLDFSLRNMALRPGSRTEVPGLYLTGASTACGGAVLGTLRGGVETASAVLGRRLWDEVRVGAVFGRGLTDTGFATPDARPAGAREHLLEVTAVQRHTPESVVVELGVPDVLAGVYAFRPGQHLTVRGEAAGEQVRRSYSLCDAPASGRLRIAVKHVPGGIFSSHALTRLAPGDRLLVAPPGGSFGVPEPDGRPRAVVAIAAGSGITPVVSVLAHVLATEPDTTCTLLYGNRTTGSTMFRAEIEELGRRHPGRLRVEHHLSRQEPPDLDGHHAGRLDAAALAGHLPDPAVDRVDAWLVCGPAGLISTATDVLTEHGIGRAAITTEVFDAGHGVASLPVGIAPDAVADVHLTLDGDTVAFRMRAARETVLDAAVRERDDLPFSCMSGTCGSCIARVREGEVVVSDVPDAALDDAERASGLTLLCLSHPAGERLVVDVGR